MSRGPTLSISKVLNNSLSGLGATISNIVTEGEWKVLQNREERMWRMEIKSQLLRGRTITKKEPPLSRHLLQAVLIPLMSHPGAIFSVQREEIRAAYVLAITLSATTREARGSVQFLTREIIKPVPSEKNQPWTCSLSLARPPYFPREKVGQFFIIALYGAPPCCR